MLDGQHVRLALRWPVSEDPTDMPISGPAKLAPRGERLLATVGSHTELGPRSPAPADCFSPRERKGVQEAADGFRDVPVEPDRSE